MELLLERVDFAGGKSALTGPTSFLSYDVRETYTSTAYTTAVRAVVMFFILFLGYSYPSDPPPE